MNKSKCVKPNKSTFTAQNIFKYGLNLKLDIIVSIFSKIIKFNALNI